MYKCKIVLMPDVFYRVFKILNKDDDDDAIIIIIIIIIIVIVIVILVRISEEFGREMFCILARFISEEFGRKMFRILARRNQVKLPWPNRKIEATKPFFILSFIEDAALEERGGC